MIHYLQELKERGNLEMVSATITESGITYTMVKDDYELSHHFTHRTIKNLYAADYAIKSSLEQMAIDLCRLAAEGGKDGSDNTTKEISSN